MFPWQNARAAAANAAKVDESRSAEQPIYGDPTDPLKAGSSPIALFLAPSSEALTRRAVQFFTVQDRTFEDGVQLMLVLAVLYTLVQALKLTLGSKGL